MAFPNNRTLVGVIMSMIAWAVWFVVVYGLTGVGCDAGWHLQDTALGNRLSVAMVAVTLLTVAFQAWCAWRGWVGYRAGREGTAGPGLEADRRALPRPGDAGGRADRDRVHADDRPADPDARPLRGLMEMR